MIEPRKKFHYIGEDDPPVFIPENFIDEEDLIAILESNCRKAGELMAQEREDNVHNS